MKNNPYIICNTSRCVECHACEAACKAVHEVEPGVKWRWVESIWQGEYPLALNHSISIGCHHCEDAPCAESCPSGAISQNKRGFVLVAAERCQSSKTCLETCPYDIPQFGVDKKMQKCNLCVTLNQKGEPPVCIKTCPAEALSLK